MIPGPINSDDECQVKDTLEAKWLRSVRKEGAERKQIEHERLSKLATTTFLGIFARDITQL